MTVSSAPKRSTAAPTPASRFPSRRREVRDERLAGTVGVGLEVDGEHPGAVVHQPLGDGAADAPGRAGDCDCRVSVCGGTGHRQQGTTRARADHTHLPPVSAVALRRLRRRALDHRRRAGKRPLDYWADAHLDVRRRRLAVDLLRRGSSWPSAGAAMGDPPPDRRRTHSPGCATSRPPRRRDVVADPRPPAAGRARSCIVDFSPIQSQLAVIRPPA